MYISAILYCQYIFSYILINLVNGTVIIKQWNIWNRVLFSIREMERNTLKTHSVKIYTSIILIFIQKLKCNPTQMAKMKNSRLSLCEIGLRFSNEKLHYFRVMATVNVWIITSRSRSLIRFSIFKKVYSLNKVRSITHAH